MNGNTRTVSVCRERGLSARSLRRAALLHVSKHALHHGLVKGAVGRVVAGRHCDEAERVDHPDGAERPRAARVVPHLAWRQLGATTMKAEAWDAYQESVRMARSWMPGCRCGMLL